jgi:hypothetical protein
MVGITDNNNRTFLKFNYLGKHGGLSVLLVAPYIFGTDPTNPVFGVDIADKGS